ncbi:hypothetical protein VAPA_1c01020 [Variovorax paradoxus B4]|uniref:Uncharacterized protein n=1 Tax=Variovorax paradoxus B4 TaxID=1246301 RepID=T1X3R1_VARPD|nr:hypothetical protein VAPA_1c01020 [Variovorax paradoxus B4]
MGALRAAARLQERPRASQPARPPRGTGPTRQPHHPPGHHRHDREQHCHVRRGRQPRESAMRRSQPDRQHPQAVADAGHHDEDAQPAAPLHQVFPPVRGRGQRGKHREHQRHGALQTHADRREHRGAAGHDRAVERRQRGDRDPGCDVQGAQREIVVEQRLHEDPEQHGVADGDGDQRRLPEPGHQRFEQRRGPDDLHAKAERQCHAGARSRQAGAVASEHQRQQEQQRDRHAAQGGVEQGRGKGGGHAVVVKAADDNRPRADNRSARRVKNACLLCPSSYATNNVA